MDSTKFNSLMTKFQSATWSISNAISNTKLFTTTINEQKIKLYNVENGPLYINSQRVDLTTEQIQSVLSYVNELIDSFASEITDAETEIEQNLLTAIDRILE